MKNLPKDLVVSACLALAFVFALVGCTTVAPTVTVSDRVKQIVAQEPGDVALVLTPVLAKNPKYIGDAKLLGTLLPALLASGPITPSSYTAAVATIPGITDQEKSDLAIAGAVLDAGLQLYGAYSNKTVILYTDPNVKALVDGFCAGILQAVGNLPAPAA